MVEGLGSSSKRRKVQKVVPGFTKEKRNLIVKSQKVLTGRVFYSKICYEPGMSEMIQIVEH